MVWNHSAVSLRFVQASVSSDYEDDSDGERVREGRSLSNLRLTALKNNSKFMSFCSKVTFRVGRTAL